MRASVPAPLASTTRANSPHTASSKREMLSGIFPLIKCFNIKRKSTLAVLNRLPISNTRAVITQVITQLNKQLENTGIDPVTSRMLSEHSTI